MARVSQQHLDARRRQIMDGAALRFARNGFHATSMQDVLKEVDLSAGAVYRYFRGKDELIQAIVTEVLDDVRAAFEAVGKEPSPPPPHELVGTVLGQMLRSRPVLQVDGVSYFPRLMVQVWTETLRNERLATVLHEGYAKVRDAWVEIVKGYQEAGMMRADLDPDAVARTMIAAVQGFAAQQALFGELPVETLQVGLRGLMSMGDPAGS
ncbi:TetR/AcrR family transcriptional regulator [Streptomyces longispororuber]|uniref:TetR/AcrR family transcriptional regulator n=1 Tax=Streptomyces longispororuber TaxID=68230 RepID=UPI00210B5C80|nr:TetR/AcrR family transcriptional regulator [Streptomyces longispororuber]MCQ4207885.1 TetR/AcrR family transcriptional regulator [Streptomyces longispororuber]